MNLKISSFLLKEKYINSIELKILFILFEKKGKIIIFTNFLRINSVGKQKVCKNLLGFLESNL